MEQIDLADPKAIKRAMRKAKVTMADVAEAWGYLCRETVGRRITSGKMTMAQCRVLLSKLGYTKITAS